MPRASFSLVAFLMLDCCVLVACFLFACCLLGACLLHVFCSLAACLLRSCCVLAVWSLSVLCVLAQVLALLFEACKVRLFQERELLSRFGPRRSFSSKMQKRRSRCSLGAFFAGRLSGFSRFLRRAPKKRALARCFCQQFCYFLHRIRILARVLRASAGKSPSARHISRKA